MSTPSENRAPRIVLAGAVNSSRLTFEALLRHKAPLLGVLGLSPEPGRRASGYVDLVELAGSEGVPAVHFENINDTSVAQQVAEWDPEVLMVVGLSQMVRQPLLDAPRRACVGYHPTALPRGRGRAPIAWLTLDGTDGTDATNGTDGAATFFVMTPEADAGGVLVQEPFEVPGGAYAADVVAVQSEAITRALDRWLPRMLEGWWDPVPQDENLATWNGRRGPADGWIDWSRSAEEILGIVRTASKPHPGAYTYSGGEKLVVWRASLETDWPIRGAVGRVLVDDEHRGLLVQAGDGLIWLSEFEGPTRPGVGSRLGFVVENELAKLSGRVAELEKRLEQLAEGQRDESVRPAA